MTKSYPIIRRIVISVLLIIIVLCASGYVTQYVSNTTRQECWTELQSSTFEFDNRLNNYLTNVRSSLRGQSNMFASESDLKAPKIYSMIKNGKNDILLTSLRLYLPDGYAVLEDGPHNDVSNLISYADIYSDRGYFNEARVDPFNPGKYIIEFFYPIRKKADIIAMFCAVIHLENIPIFLPPTAYNGKSHYCITSHKDGTVLVDTRSDKIWNVNDVEEREQIYGYSYKQWHKQMQNGEEANCVFYGNNMTNIIYGYTLPSQVSGINVSLMAAQETVMSKNKKIMQVLWYAFFIEVIAFICFLLWILFDTSHQIQVERALAQKEELEKQQTALEQALNMAKSANRAKTIFLNNMSHDIRTPMNAIIGYAELAKININNPEKVSDYLTKIGLSSDHLLSLINDILDMSRIESGKMNLEFKNESLTQIINTLESMIQADLIAKNLEFTIDQMEIKDDIISCDKLRLNQVLLNILSNAIKYTQDGGKISLSITQKEKTDEAAETTPYEFRIKDNGIGMSKEFLKNIYEPFTRVKSSTVSGIQGTGLGMSIAKNLVEMMNGTIQIISKEQIGTEVVLHFDFKVSSNRKTSVTKDTEQNGEFNFTGKKILLVEDNEMNLEIAQELLQEMGCITSTANDGSVAVDMIKTAKKGDFDLILMDVQMPIMNGYEATQKIRSLELSDYTNIPIIAMTANAFAEDRKEAMKAGMNEHIPKPLSIPQLKETMSKFL